MIFDFLILATRFPTSIVNSVSPVELWIVSRLILPSGICSIKSWDAVPDSVAVPHCVPFPCGHCFPSEFSEALNTPSKRKEKKVDDRVERRRASLPYHMLPQDSH